MKNLMFIAVAFCVSNQALATTVPHLFTCVLKAQSKSMPEAKIVSDEILLPIASSDKYRNRKIHTGHKDLIDAFGNNLTLEFSAHPPGTDGKAPLLVKIGANLKGMKLASNIAEVGLLGEIDLSGNDKEFYLAYDDILKEDFSGFYIALTNQDSPASDKRKFAGVFCTTAPLP